MVNETTTVIPGGMALWYDRNTLTPRRERMMQTSIVPLRHLVVAIQDSDYPFTKQEASDLLSMNELAVIVFLKSWTLKDKDGADVPIPADADAVLDLDRELYDVLLVQAGKLLADTLQDGSFTVDAVEDADSPTGGLGA